MHLIYFILLALLSPLAAIPIYLIFVGGPFLILYILNLPWRLNRRIPFPGAMTVPMLSVAPTIPLIHRKPYKPKGRRSKMAGIRKNRAILAVANGSVRCSEPVRH